MEILRSRIKKLLKSCIRNKSTSSMTSFPLIVCCGIVHYVLELFRTGTKNINCAFFLFGVIDRSPLSLVCGEMINAWSNHAEGFKNSTRILCWAINCLIYAKGSCPLSSLTRHDCDICLRGPVTWSA